MSNKLEFNGNSFGLFRAKNRITAVALTPLKITCEVTAILKKNTLPLPTYDNQHGQLMFGVVQKVRNNTA